MNAFHDVEIPGVFPTGHLLYPMKKGKRSRHHNLSVEIRSCKNWEIELKGLSQGIGMFTGGISAGTNRRFNYWWLGGELWRL